MSAPVITVPEMREWEAESWAAGRTEAAIIRRVGEVIARKILALTDSGDLILLLAGPGHNGDDVRAANDFLAGLRVELLNVTAPPADLPRLEALLAHRPALVVDGLFGIGLNRPLDADWINFIERINAAGLPVLAVDTPSGLDADSGVPQGAAIRATYTLAIGAAKRGQLLPDAWPFLGRLDVATDVGLIPCPQKNELNWIAPGDFAGFPPLRSANTNKGSYGHVAIIAGSVGYHGAAVLATRGAQRAQPGLVTLFTMENIFHPVATQLQSAMVLPWKPNSLVPENTTAIVFGPGLAATGMPEELKLGLRRIWLEAKVPVVVDASALSWLPLYPLPQTAARVITPHPGEAARLLKTSIENIQANRPHAVREIAKQYCNCWVVLKGHQTLIGRATGDILVNSSGNPHLAQGGSGDLLAGFLGGLLAQPRLQADALKTISYAVWEHGAAADRLARTRKNWIVEDLANVIGDV